MRITKHFPGIYKFGLKNLKETFGFEIVEYATARMDMETLYLNSELRAKDIQDAFEDDSIDGIICSIVEMILFVYFHF